MYLGPVAHQVFQLLVVIAKYVNQINLDSDPPSIFTMKK